MLEIEEQSESANYKEKRAFGLLAGFLDELKILETKYNSHQITDYIDSDRETIRYLAYRLLCMDNLHNEVDLIDFIVKYEGVPSITLAGFVWKESEYWH